MKVQLNKLLKPIGFECCSSSAMKLILHSIVFSKRWDSETQKWLRESHCIRQKWLFCLLDNLKVGRFFYSIKLICNKHYRQFSTFEVIFAVSTLVAYCQSIYTKRSITNSFYFKIFQKIFANILHFMYIKWNIVYGLF